MVAHGPPDSTAYEVGPRTRGSHGPGVSFGLWRKSLEPLVTYLDHRVWVSCLEIPIVVGWVVQPGHTNRMVLVGCARGVEVEATDCGKATVISFVLPF